MTVSEQLESQIRLYPETVYRLSKETGIPQPTLLRFLSGERGLAMGSIDKLADFFGLELQPKAAKGNPAKAPSNPAKGTKGKRGELAEQSKGRPKKEKASQPARLMTLDDLGLTYSDTIDGNGQLTNPGDPSERIEAVAVFPDVDEETEEE
jgi:hypothetical protein